MYFNSALLSPGQGTALIMIQETKIRKLQSVLRPLSSPRPFQAPSIMCGDLNCTTEALKDEMGVMYFDEIEEDMEMSAAQRGEHVRHRG